MSDAIVSKVLERLYQIGLRPEWWKLEPQNDAHAWQAIDEIIATYDRYCRGVVLLGLGASIESLAVAFRLAARAKSVRGFAVGRTIFADAAHAWLAGNMSDATAVDEMAARFTVLVEIWQSARLEAAT
jgi:5-dehydro-2-deoxygluconokinase